MLFEIVFQSFHSIGSMWRSCDLMLFEIVFQYVHAVVWIPSVVI